MSPRKTLDPKGRLTLAGTIRTSHPKLWKSGSLGLPRLPFGSQLRTVANGTRSDSEQRCQSPPCSPLVRLIRAEPR